MWVATIAWLEEWCRSQPSIQNRDLRSLKQSMQDPTTTPWDQPPQHIFGRRRQGWRASNRLGRVQEEIGPSATDIQSRDHPPVGESRFMLEKLNKIGFRSGALESVRLELRGMK